MTHPSAHPLLRTVWLTRSRFPAVALRSIADTPDNHNKTLSYISNLSFVNITAAGQPETQLGTFTCLAASPCHGITVKGLALTGFQKSPMTCQAAFGDVSGVTGGAVCIKPEGTA